MDSCNALFSATGSAVLSMLKFQTLHRFTGQRTSIVFIQLITHIESIAVSCLRNFTPSISKQSNNVDDDAANTETHNSVAIPCSYILNCHSLS